MCSPWDPTNQQKEKLSNGVAEAAHRSRNWTLETARWRYERAMDSCLGLVDATWQIGKSWISMDGHGPVMDVICTNWRFSHLGSAIYKRPGHKEHGSDPQRVAIQRGSQCVRRRCKQSRRHIRGLAERGCWVVGDGGRVESGDVGSSDPGFCPHFAFTFGNSCAVVRAFAQNYPIQIGKKCEEEVPVATFKTASATMIIFIAIITIIQHLTITPTSMAHSLEPQGKFQ